MDRLRRIVDRAAEGLTLAAAVILFALMVVVVIDVTGRYVFNAPLPGGFELVKLGMGVLAFAALPLVTLRDRHITVDLVSAALPPAMQGLQRASVQVMSIAVLCGLSWRLWAEGGKLARWGETTATLGLPMAPLAYAMAVLTAITALMCLPLLLQGLIPGRASPTAATPVETGGST